MRQEKFPTSGSALHYTFAPSALSTRLVIQVDIQVEEAALWWEWVLGREQTDTDH